MFLTSVRQLAAALFAITLLSGCATTGDDAASSQANQKPVATDAQLIADMYQNLTAAEQLQRENPGVILSYEGVGGETLRRAFPVTN